MLIITLEGGQVSSVTTDDPALRDLLNQQGVAVIDYDVEDYDESEIINVFIPSRGGPGIMNEAVAYTAEVEDTDIDTERLMTLLARDT